MNAKTYSVKTSLLENGDVMLELPDELLKSMGWQEGNEISIEIDEDTGNIVLSKVPNAE